MTEREMFELAAKAAGNGAQWDGPDRKMMVLTDDEIDTRTWNPRDNNCDAFQLAVTLSQRDGGLALMLNSRLNSTSYAQCYTNCDVVSPMEYMGDDPFASARLVIFKAAVEIGKSING